MKLKERIEELNGRYKNGTRKSLTKYTDSELKKSEKTKVTLVEREENLMIICLKIMQIRRASKRPYRRYVFRQELIKFCDHSVTV